MNSSNLLRTIGDDWHNPNPYLGLIEKVVPDSPFKDRIEHILLEIYVQEHYDFKMYKNITGSTLYDDDIESACLKMKGLEEEKKKEEERFEKLVTKFKEQNPPESNSEEEKPEEKPEEEQEEEQEEQKEDVVVVKQKGKGQQACRRSLKKEEQIKKALVNSIKVAMAASQAKLIELGEEMEKLEKLVTYYQTYQYASRQYALTVKQIVLAYSQNKDVELLIHSLADAVVAHEKMMRRSVPSKCCEGEGKGLCNIHLLPLYLTVYPNQGYKHVWKCAVNPLV